MVLVRKRRMSSVLDRLVILVQIQLCIEAAVFVYVLLIFDFLMI